MRCVGLDGSRLDPASLDSRRVLVSTDGQASIANALFEPVPPPIVQEVAPAQAAAGSNVVILGRHFGYIASDLLRVAVDGSPCASQQFRSSSVVTCRLPEPRAWRVEASSRGNTTVLSGLSVRVSTRGGQRSDPATAAVVSYPSVGAVLPHAPTQVLGWRERGRPDTLMVRWVYPREEWALQGMTEPSEYHVEVFSVAQPELGGTQQRFRVAEIESRREDEDMVVMRHTLQITDAGPVRVRVRATSSAGDAPWSELTGAIPPSCLRTEFLATHLDIGRWTCLPCALEANRCSGGPAQVVEPAAGYQRIGWSAGRLSFAACPNPDSCIVVEASNESSRAGGIEGAGQVRRMQGAAVDDDGIFGASSQVAPAGSAPGWVKEGLVDAIQQAWPTGSDSQGASQALTSS